MHPTLLRMRLILYLIFIDCLDLGIFALRLLNYYTFTMLTLCIYIIGTEGSHGPAMLLPPPLFSYQEINVSAGIAGLAPFIQINQNVSFVSLSACLLFLGTCDYKKA